MDKVPIEIKKAINDFGTDIINERRLVYILSDYGVLKDLRAERRILMDIIDGGYSERILQHSMETGDPSLKICSYISEMHSRYGYQIKKLMFVFQWLVDGLGIKTVPFDTILHVKSDEEDIEEIIIEGKYSVKDPFSLIPNYHLPDLSLLKSGANVCSDDMSAVVEHVRTVLHDYNIEIENVDSYQTPVMNFLSFSLSSDVRMTKLIYLHDKISDALAPVGSRMLVPIPGTNRIGVEIPKDNSSSISFFPAGIETGQGQFRGLHCSIGVEPDGTPFSFRLDEVGHVLISGMANSGKTNCIHSMMLSLMFCCNPCILKFAIISSNNASYHSYEKIARNYLAKSHSGKYIADDEDSTSMLLMDIEQEMVYRKELLSKSSSANIREYNTKYLSGDLNPDEGHVFLPYVVVIVDELSELNEIKSVNSVMANLVKNGQDSGICLVMATANRIKRTVMTYETMKGLHAKITFKHEDSIMAKAFSDTSDSTKLMPFGDLLYQDSSMVTTKRVSNALIDDSTKGIILHYLSTQPRGKNDYILKHSDRTGTNSDHSHSLQTDGELFAKAARLIVAKGKCSEAILQKELRCSFNAAHNILLRLDELGVTRKNGGIRIVLDTQSDLETLLRGAD